MNEKELIKQTKDNYNRIAGEFSSKRRYLSDDILYFKKYIEPKDSILDLGCGNGRLTQMLNKTNTYLGIDNSKGLIEIARKHYPDHKFKIADVLNLNLKEKFDVITSLSVIHHIPQKHHKDFIKSISEHLKKNGIAIVTSWKYKKDLVKTSKKISKNEYLYPFKDSRGKVLANRYFIKLNEKELISLFPKSQFKLIESGAKWRGKNENYFVVFEKI